MTVINIGTNKKNIVGVEIDKPFKDITIKDIYQIIKDKLGEQKNLMIFGWANVTKND